MIVPLTIGLIFILLYTAFNSVPTPLIIANVPFAIIGGIVRLFVTGSTCPVPSAIGFITVFGVAMLNGIVMCPSSTTLRRQGLVIRDAVRQARRCGCAGADDGLGGDPSAWCRCCSTGVSAPRRNDHRHGRRRRPVHVHGVDAAAAADLRVVRIARGGPHGRRAPRPRPSQLPQENA